MRRLALILVAAATALFSAALYADDYPTRPITMVAVFGPGSASDTICRILADKFGPAIGQPVVVVDKPGVDGALAAAYVSHQPADGYTLLMATPFGRSAGPPLLRARSNFRYSAPVRTCARAIGSIRSQSRSRWRQFSRAFASTFQIILASIIRSSRRCARGSVSA